MSGMTDVRRCNQKTFPGDSSKESGNNLYGCLKQVSRQPRYYFDTYEARSFNTSLCSSTSSSSLTGRCTVPVLESVRGTSSLLPHRNIKTVLSVGGGSYSHAGAFNFVTDSSKRSTFVTSAVQLVEDYGLDGIDIDFEFPDTDALGSGLASLVTELRTALDSLQKSKGDATPYLVTVRVSPGDRQRSAARIW